MKRFAKLSLVTAISLGAMSSGLSAKDLSEAIKGVDISGTVVYRYDDRKSDNAGQVDDNGINLSKNNYKAVVNIKTPINDDLALNTSLLAGGSDSGFASLDYTTQGDSNVAITLSKVNFVYTGISNTTAVIGKQGIVTPFTVSSDSDGNEQIGTGLTAIADIKNIDIIAGYFNQTNLNASGKLTGDITGAEDIATVGISSNIGPVSGSAWYFDMVDVFNAYTAEVNYGAKISDVAISLFARYSALDFDDKATATTIGTGKDNSLWKIGLSAKTGIYGLKLKYGQTGDEGGLVALDNSTKVAMEAWTTNLNGQVDASFLQTNINAQIIPSVNLALNYNIRDGKDNADDADEIYLQGTWKPTKNFYTYIRFGQNTKSDDSGKDTDSTIGRLQVQYTF